MLVKKINEYLNWRDTPDYREPRPKNSFLNTELTDKWSNKTDLDYTSFELQKSFHLHHASFKDCYLKYTQFRTLHRRFFTNDKLHKMGIKPSGMCSFCKVSSDSVDHMLLYCNIVQNLWLEVNNWIIELGFKNYNLTNSRKFLGDLDNGPIINSIILLTKKVIYDSFKEEKKPVFIHIKMRSKTTII